MEQTQILREDGDNKVRILTDRYGTHLEISKNGWQWTGTEINDSLTKLLIEALQKHEAGNHD